MLGMWIFLVSLGMVFLTTVIAYLIIRGQLISTGEWRLDDPPGLPGLLYLSTILLIATSMLLHVATTSARRTSQARSTGRWMCGVCVLVFCFLITQTIAWIDLATNEGLGFDSSLYAWLFYVLTGLHVAHVLVGLPPLLVTPGMPSQGDTSTNVVMCPVSPSVRCTGTFLTGSGWSCSSSCFSACVDVLGVLTRFETDSVSVGASWRRSRNHHRVFRKTSDQLESRGLRVRRP